MSQHNLDHTAYIALGSNLSNPVEQLHKALQALRTHPGIDVIRHTEHRITQPFPGSPPQPDFANSVVLINTSLSPTALLKATQAIEITMGRPTVHTHWGPRIIDLDILLYNNTTVNSDDLVIPHPGITQRLFLLELIETLTPGLRLPDGSTVLGHLAALQTAALATQAEAR